MKTPPMAPRPPLDAASVASELRAGLPALGLPRAAATLPVVRVRVPRAQGDAAGIARAIEAAIADALGASGKARG